jgi:hypothetical protein
VPAAPRCGQNGERLSFVASLGAFQIHTACSRLDDTPKPTTEKQRPPSGSRTARVCYYFAIDCVNDRPSAATNYHGVEPPRVPLIHPFISRHQLAAYVTQSTRFQHISDHFGVGVAACPIRHVSACVRRIVANATPSETYHLLKAH